MNKINYIADGMNWNGMTFIDGDKEYKVSQVTFKIEEEKISQVENTPTVIESGDFNITSDGVYKLAKGYSGTINIDAENVKIIQEDPTTPLNDVHIVGLPKGNANLWIEDLNVENLEEHGDSIIKFQGENNVLSFK